MAKSIVKAGIPCLGYDAYPPSLEKFVAIGGKAASSLVEVATGTDVLVLMVVNAQQVEDVLFGEQGVGHREFLSHALPLFPIRRKGEAELVPSVVASSTSPRSWSRRRRFLHRPSLRR